MSQVHNSFEASVPASNYKIIELFNKIKSGVLDTAPEFQRKLVWKKQHKLKFIETILMNFPFPEVYIAPGSMDIVQLKMNELIVDGQQRLTTIVNYIEGKDVFALNKLGIQKFNELDAEQKKAFLNYEVSVRYLKNATTEQIIEIFQRINNTEYALNNTERLNAQWGDSEFICFAKQLIEKELDIDTELIAYVIDTQNRNFFLSFFHSKYSIFTENDNNRMLALQYILTLLATLCTEHYFRRNDLTQFFIEAYYQEFPEASNIESRLLQVVQFIDGLNFDKKSYWFNKANMFTLICELYKYDCSKIDAQRFGASLLSFEENYRKYTIYMLEDELGFQIIDDTTENSTTDTSELNFDERDIKYFEFAREAVNEKQARDYRGERMSEFIRESLNVEP